MSLSAFASSSQSAQHLAGSSPLLASHCRLKAQHVRRPATNIIVHFTCLHSIFLFLPPFPKFSHSLTHTPQKSWNIFYLVQFQKYNCNGRCTIGTDCGEHSRATELGRHRPPFTTKPRLHVSKYNTICSRALVPEFMPHTVTGKVKKEDLHYSCSSLLVEEEESRIEQT